MLRALTLGTALMASALLLPGAASAGQRDDGYRDRDRDYSMRDRDRDERPPGWRRHGDHYDHGLHYGWEQGRHRGWDKWDDDHGRRRHHDSDDWRNRDRDRDHDRD
jgi:hypothetical protein